MLYLSVVLLVIVLLTGVWLSAISQKGVAAGVVNGKLTPCPPSPNCVCSEFPEKPYYVEALLFQGDPRDAWVKAVQAVQNTGGEIVTEDGSYLAAVYKSRFFRFVDDLELRLDPAAGNIQVRSSSRAGHSDFGVNARRVTELRTFYSKM